jgi:predicted LPLAT superfamily acyltransferase
VHRGYVEACRALAQLQGGKTINALVFSENAQRFKQIMTEMAPQAGLNRRHAIRRRAAG